MTDAPERIWVDFLAEIGQGGGFTERAYETPEPGTVPYIRDEVTEEMVERAARATWNFGVERGMGLLWESAEEDTRESFRHVARAALEAALKEG